MKREAKSVTFYVVGGETNAWADTSATYAN